MYKILVATDGSPQSQKTLEYVAQIAVPLKAEVTVLSVAQEVPVLKSHEGISFEQTANFEKNIAAGMRQMAEDALAIAKKYFDEKGIKITTRVETGHPAEIIVKMAEDEGFDQVVLGSRGLGGIKGVLLGSVSSKVVNRAHTNVTVVK
jgi:nucleotide-binding universal stress UspA family protein